MPASVFAREYLNQFDSIESRFFSLDAIAAAFGAVQGQTPDDADDDPIVAQGSAFGGRATVFRSDGLMRGV